MSEYKLFKKKNLMGKTRNIYKKKGSNKEYLKYKGKMMNVVKYKKMKTIKNKTIKNKTIKTKTIKTKTKKTKTKTKKGKKGGAPGAPVREPRAPVREPRAPVRDMHQLLSPAGSTGLPTLSTAEDQDNFVKTHPIFIFIQSIKNEIDTIGEKINRGSIKSDRNEYIFYIMIRRAELFVRNPYRRAVGFSMNNKYYKDYNGLERILHFAGYFARDKTNEIRLEDIINGTNDSINEVFVATRVYIQTEMKREREKEERREGSNSGLFRTDPFKYAFNLITDEYEEEKENNWNFSKDIEQGGYYFGRKIARAPAPAPPPPPSTSSPPSQTKSFIQRTLSSMPSMPSMPFTRKKT